MTHDLLEELANQRQARLATLAAGAAHRSDAPRRGDHPAYPGDAAVLGAGRIGEPSVSGVLAAGGPRPPVAGRRAEASIGASSR